jgi:hypothetical protein
LAASGGVHQKGDKAGVEKELNRPNRRTECPFLSEQKGLRRGKIRRAPGGKVTLSGAGKMMFCPFPEKSGQSDEESEQNYPGGDPPEEKSPGFLFTVGDRGQCFGYKTKHRQSFGGGRISGLVGRKVSVDVVFFGFIAQAAETEFEQVCGAHF